MRSTLIIIAALLFALWLGGLIKYAVSAQNIHAEKQTLKTNAVIVLTGGNHRIQTGLELFASAAAPNLYITGVFENTSKEDILRFAPTGATLPPCCLELGHEARSTKENAAEVKEWLRGKQFHSIRLVTSPYHMERALLEFKAAMPEVTFITHPVTKPDREPNSWPFWEIVISEYHKYLWRRAQLLITDE